MSTAEERIAALEEQVIDLRRRLTRSAELCSQMADAAKETISIMRTLTLTIDALNHRVDTLNGRVDALARLSEQRY